MGYVKAGTDFVWGAYYNNVPESNEGAAAQATTRLNNLLFSLRTIIVGNGDNRYVFRSVTGSATAFTLAVRLTANVDFGDTSHVFAIIKSNAESAGFRNLTVTAASPGGAVQPSPMPPASPGSSPSAPYFPSSPGSSPLALLPNGASNSSLAVQISGKYLEESFLKKYGGWLAIGAVAILVVSSSGRR